MEDVEQFASQRKPRRIQTNSRWFAVCEDIFEHPIVGMDVPPPKPADPSKPAMFPFMVWVWMCGAAAYRARQVVIKDQYIDLARGQLVMSERYLAQKANWGRKAAHHFLFRLARHGMVQLSTVARGGQLMLDFSSSKRGPGRGPTPTIVTLCNYDVYQLTPPTKGATLGAARGPIGGQRSTSDNLTSGLHQSTVGTSGEVGGGKEAPAGIDGAGEGALPFTAETIRQLSALDGLDIEKLISAYFERTAKLRVPVKNPDAYLLRMGHKEVAARLKITVDQLKRVISGNKAERILAEANVVGAFSRPSEDALKRARRYRTPAEIELALQALAGRSFTSQRAADTALEQEFIVMRWSRRAG